MKKICFLITLLVVSLSTTVFAGEQLSGGWSATTDVTITEEAQSAFDNAMNTLVGVDYEPIDLLATQVVAGTNYCFLCRSTVVVPDAIPSYAFVYVYEDLQGNAEILGIKDITFGDGILEDNVETAENNEKKDGEYEIGETWTVEGQWELTVDSVEETQDRNEYSDKEPGAVYIVTFTYNNIGYEDDFMDGLYFIMDDRIVDAEGRMGYSYPGNITYYPQEAPVGASCTGQVCIGVENPGSFKIYVDTYDGNDEEQNAVFHVTVN